MTGLPNPRADHAMVLCRFARDILYQSQSLFKKLEVKLGPGTHADFLAHLPHSSSCLTVPCTLISNDTDTGDLSVRIGIHSGPVTGGMFFVQDKSTVVLSLSWNLNLPCSFQVF